jgi:hypothetical protein
MLELYYIIIIPQFHNCQVPWAIGNGRLNISP